MAKRLCELCGTEEACDMRFGVKLCASCVEKYSKAITGDPISLAFFSTPANFTSATEEAKNKIIAPILRRHNPRVVNKIIGDDIKTNKEIETKKSERKQYARSIGINYTEDNESNEESGLDLLYDNIGEKIKAYAKCVFVFSAIISVILGIVLLAVGASLEVSGLSFLGILLGIIGIFASLILSWLLYAMGELVDKTSYNERNTHNILKLMLENQTKESRNKED
jgi:hypothetical protein